MSAGLPYAIVAIVPRQYANPISDAPTEPRARRRVLASTYHPSANSIETSTRVLLHSQEARDGVDIRMRKVESYCMEATLTENGLPARMQYKLVETAVSDGSIPSVNLPQSSGLSSSNGKIRLCDLYPGQYQLIAARLSTAAQEAIGTINFTIIDKDILELVVAAVPRLTVNGELGWDKLPTEATNQTVQVRTIPSPIGSNSIIRMPVP